MEETGKKPRRRRWIVAAIGVALLYVASSGPLQFSQSRIKTATFDDDGPGRWSDKSSADELARDEQGEREELRGVQLDVALIERAAWWPTVYSPLLWVARQSWGRWLGDYWGLFPVREASLGGGVSVPERESRYLDTLLATFWRNSQDG